MKNEFSDIKLTIVGQGPFEQMLREKVEAPKRLEVVDKKVDVLPKVKEVCPKCKHDEAFYWTVQTRASDEAETRFFKCVKCQHTWRMYD